MSDKTGGPANQIAYRKVKSAIKSGALVRASTCQNCGLPGKASSDGRSTIHAHHKNYSKPLEVEWLCAKCHRAITPLPKIMGRLCFGNKNGSRTRPESRPIGENHMNSKLSLKEVLDIKKSKLSVKTLSIKYKTSASNIYNIKNGYKWKRAIAERSKS